MTVRIKHISFLYDGTRHIAVSNSRGRFTLRAAFSTDLAKAFSRVMTAAQFIENHLIKKSDPVITLVTGEKLRVFQGGDPTATLVATISAIEAHDKSYTKSQRKKKNVIIPASDLFIDFPEW